MSIGNIRMHLNCDNCLISGSVNFDSAPNDILVDAAQAAKTIGFKFDADNRVLCISDCISDEDSEAMKAARKRSTHD